MPINYKRKTTFLFPKLRRWSTPQDPYFMFISKITCVRYDLERLYVCSTHIFIYKCVSAQVCLCMCMYACARTVCAMHMRLRSSSMPVLKPENMCVQTFVHSYVFAYFVFQIGNNWSHDCKKSLDLLYTPLNISFIALRMDYWPRTSRILTRK